MGTDNDEWDLAKCSAQSSPQIFCDDNLAGNVEDRLQTCRFNQVFASSSCQFSLTAEHLSQHTLEIFDYLVELLDDRPVESHEAWCHPDLPRQEHPLA